MPRGRIVWLCLCVASAGAWISEARGGDERTVPPPPTIEFRWAENSHREGITRPARVELACTEHPVFLHAKPVLRVGDFAGARLSPVQGTPGDRFSIVVDLTRDAAHRMAKSSAEHLHQPLVVLLDGQVISGMVIKTRVTDFVLIYGMFTRAEAERIAAATKGPVLGSGSAKSPR